MLSKIIKKDLKLISAGWQWDEHGTLWLSEEDVHHLRHCSHDLFAYCSEIIELGHFFRESFLVSFFLTEKLKSSPSQNRLLNCHKFIRLIDFFF